MRKSVMQKSVVKKSDNDNKTNTCTSVIEYAKSLCKNTNKYIDSVTLLSSQYPACSNINIKLIPELSSKMTSTFIVIEGETKIYKNTKKDGKPDPYCLRIKPNAISPLLYQLLEHIYSNIRDGVRVPPNLANLQISDFTEKTFTGDSMYINKLNGAVVEYTSYCSKSITSAISNELEHLSTRDNQMAKIIVTPIVFYKNGTDVKVTFALKKLTIEREFSANVIDIDGSNGKVSMSETNEEDIVRGMGLMEVCDNDCNGNENDSETTLFNV
ncbi:ssDNA-binding phosphoprotein [Hypsugopox virus]|nr:ssDNA-binding phosphoprotein [Hypsugopox virus]